MKAWTSPVTRIISGGQTGVDRTALEVAQELGLATGGTAPAGFRTDLGPDTSLRDVFGLTACISPQYPMRTRLNVMDSDGTLLSGVVSSPGSRLTVRLCMEYHKPLIVNPSVKELRTWLTKFNVRTLNVAGNRLRTHPESAARCRALLLNALGAENGLVEPTHDQQRITKV